MCGLLIRRCSRYYVQTIMSMLFMIGSLSFSIFSFEPFEFYNRVQVFVFLCQLMVIFKIYTSAKLPRVSYSTDFDRYSTSCQLLFIFIVYGSVASASALSWSGCSADPNECQMTDLVRKVEGYALLILVTLWLAWNFYFYMQVFRSQKLPVLEVLTSTVPVKLQEEHANAALSMSEGLAPPWATFLNSELRRRNMIMSD